MADEKDLDLDDIPDLTHPKPSKEKWGHRIELTEEDLRQIEVMAGIGLRVPDISSIVGLGHNTLYKLMKRDPRISDHINRGRAKAVSAVAQTAYQLAKGGKCPSMTMFWLKTQQKWREVHTEESKQVHEVVFKTQVGEQGQIMSEQKEIEAPDYEEDKEFSVEDEYPSKDNEDEV